LPALYSAIKKVMPDVVGPEIGTVGSRRMRGLRGLPVNSVRAVEFGEDKSKERANG